jgi:phage shock protein A
MTIECGHGQLARACTVCYLEREIAGHEAVMRQALAALENGKRVRNCEGGTLFQPPLEDAAIAALRERLGTQPPASGMDEILRLRAERDALADRLRETRAQLTDTTDAHRKQVTQAALNTWAEGKLARHGIPMPEDENPSF